MDFKVNIMKKLLYLVAGILILAMAIWLSKTPNIKSKLSTTLATEKVGVTDQVALADGGQVVDDFKKIADFSSENRPRLDAYQADKIIQFHATRGYFQEDQLVEYSSYDLLTLESLAKDGDVKAIQLLAMERLKQGEVEASFQLWLDAAVYGSTQALNLAASDKFSAFFIAEDLGEKEGYLIEAFALIHVSKRRGDHIATDSYIQLMKDIRRIDLTSEQEKKISEKADQLYEELENRRKEIGLGPFDNHVPKELKIPIS